jgi:hypothetical protein
MTPNILNNEDMRPLTDDELSAVIGAKCTQAQSDLWVDFVHTLEIIDLRWGTNFAGGINGLTC